MLASGYAPIYAQSAWDAPEMAVVARAIERVLKQQEPNPALLLDRYWNVLKTNDAAPRFFGSFVDLAARKSPRNLLHLMFDPEGLRPFVESWEDVASGLLQRVHREVAGHVLDQKTIGLLNELRRYPGVRKLAVLPKGPGAVLPITFLKGAERWSFFSLEQYCCHCAQFEIYECRFS